MAQTVWIDSATHWKAYGDEVNGRLIDAHVDDNNGSTRTRSKTFDSKSDFYAWAKAQASTPM